MGQRDPQAKGADYRSIEIVLGNFRRKGPKVEGKITGEEKS